MIMHLDQYSLLLTLSSSALLFVFLVSIFAYFFVPETKKRLLSVPYFTYMKLLGFIAIFATVSVLIYQFVYKTPVCEYCWWQRIFMFPLDVIAVGSILLHTRKNEIIIGVLASIGFVIASVHYYFHFQNVVMGNMLNSGCSVIGIVPSCSENTVLVFDFVTIPLMAMVAFAAIMWLSFLAAKSEK